jgi:hypothetical protein
MAISFSFLFLRREQGQARREWKPLKVTKGGRAVKLALVASYFSSVLFSAVSPFFAGFLGELCRLKILLDLRQGQTF